uniref:Uncharacterized protein n=1 Tax=Oryza meridionalis TaxID=40149 RepID=A0A0E0DY54_9ORYZ
MIGDETTSGSKPPVPAPTTIRLVNFISEDQVDEAKWTRGQRAGDDTTQSQSEKPLFQYHLCPFCDGCWDHKELPPQSPLTTLSTRVITAIMVGWTNLLEEDILMKD